ncbi:MAG: hypothetical protein M3Z65_00660 [Chloroflexota bacterium]|nr:hypothetical protein [Chloroflexota bacterium]
MVVPQAGEILECTYRTIVSGELVDVENVLLYNVGLSCAAAKGMNGVRFARVDEPIPRPPRAFEAHHYATYAVVAADTDPPGRARAAALVTWAGAAWPTGGAPTVGRLWRAIREAKPVVRRLDLPADAVFAIRADVPVRVNPVHVMKPLLDAIVSAFHTDVRPTTQALLDLVAAQAGLDARRVGEMLRDERFNVIGSRKVVDLYRGGVKWNPADERCVAAEVVPRTDDWPIFGGELHALSG